MYLRPDSLFHQFLIESLSSGMDDIGRPKSRYDSSGTVMAVLADAKTTEIERWKSLQHPITHTVVQKNGKVMAKPGDRFVHDNRYFYIQGVDNASLLGYFIIYYVQERSDRVE